MKESAHLEKLLDSLKKEGPFREPTRWKGVCPDKECDAPGRIEHGNEPTKHRTGVGNPDMVWSENKEAILMGMLVSVCITVVGALSGLDYIALIGSVSFAVFSAIMAWVLIEYCLCFKKPQ